MALARNIIDFTRWRRAKNKKCYVREDIPNTRLTNSSETDGNGREKVIERTAITAHLVKLPLYRYSLAIATLRDGDHGFEELRRPKLDLKRGVFLFIYVSLDSKFEKPEGADNDRHTTLSR